MAGGSKQQPACQLSRHHRRVYEDLVYLWKDSSTVLRVGTTCISDPTQEDTGESWAGSQGPGQEGWSSGQGSSLGTRTEVLSEVLDVEARPMYQAMGRGWSLRAWNACSRPAGCQRPAVQCGTTLPQETGSRHHQNDHGRGEVGEGPRSDPNTCSVDRATSQKGYQGFRGRPPR